MSSSPIRTRAQRRTPSRPWSPSEREVSGIVLAGGRSRRFGRDKLVQPVSGRPLLHHPLLALAAVCGEVIVAGPPDPRLLPPLPKLAVPLRIVSDPEPYGGPLVGLCAGLEAARWPLAVVVGGDMPQLVPALLAEMLGLLREGVDAVALQEGSRVRPLPCVLRTSTAAAIHLQLQAGRRSLHEFLETLPIQGMDEAAWRVRDPAAASLRDIDRREDIG